MLEVATGWGAGCCPGEGAWPGGRFRSDADPEGARTLLFERTCAEAGWDPGVVLEEVIGPEADSQEFWGRADRNLRGGALRLVFVADVIPDELTAVIEFLNARMHDTEVYGVEVRRYASAGTEECFVPRLIGATAAAQITKRGQAPLDERLRSAGVDVATVAERLRILADETGLSVVPAANSLRLNDSHGAVVLLYPTYRSIEFPLQFLRRAGHDMQITELREALQRIAGDSKKVSAAIPNIGCREALANWDAVTGIIQSLIHIRADQTTNTLEG